jgi:hypothetical protein
MGEWKFWEVTEESAQLMKKYMENGELYHRPTGKQKIKVLRIHYA